MSLSFSAAFASIDTGTMVQVSNGLPEPSKPGGVPHRIWRSHNFTGELVDKQGGVPRRMIFRLPQDGNVRISYTIEEGLGHSFEVAP